MRVRILRHISLASALAVAVAVAQLVEEAEESHSVSKKRAPADHMHASI